MSKESAYYILNNVNGKHDVKELKKEIDTLPGIMSVSFSDKKHSLAVDFDNSGVNGVQIEEIVKKLGYDIEKNHYEEHVM